MSDIEEEVTAQIAFFMCQSQAVKGLINYGSKEGKRIYALASAKLLDIPQSN
jgi:hypothetical protein